MLISFWGAETKNVMQLMTFWGKKTSPSIEEHMLTITAAKFLIRHSVMQYSLFFSFLLLLLLLFYPFIVCLPCFDKGGLMLLFSEV